jgi:hypothetical protein
MQALWQDREVSLELYKTLFEDNQWLDGEAYLADGPLMRVFHNPTFNQWFHYLFPPTAMKDENHKVRPYTSLNHTQKSENTVYI